MPKTQARMNRPFQTQAEVVHGNVGIADVCFWKRIDIVASCQNYSGFTWDTSPSVSLNLLALEKERKLLLTL
jgi:hypothetical protein